MNSLAGDEGEWQATLDLLETPKGITALHMHRAKHVTEIDIAEISRRGFNAVRIPFGYWIVTGPTCGDPYVGPALELLDQVVVWAKDHNLEVLLDLHGNPGEPVQFDTVS